MGAIAKRLKKVAPSAALSYTAVRNAKSLPKAFKFVDASGLFLLIQPSGG